MSPRFIIGILIILFGLSLLFGFPLFKVVVSLVLIMIGGRMMFGKNRKWDYQFRGDTDEEVFKRVLICSAINTKLTSQAFERAEVTAICGGGEIDMSRVKTVRSEVELNLVAIAGGIKVRLPKDWAVRSEGVGIIGGYDNQAKAPAKPSTTAIIKGAAILGGVEIGN